MGPPLEGIIVIDLTRAMSGPFATMLLGDFGAEVIKIEPPGGDETRRWGPPFVDGESTYFLSINRNKKSVCVDLKSKEGKGIIKKLLSSADVIIENFKPGVTQRLGLDYESVMALNPGIVYCSISGFGQTGIWKDKAGYDLVALALSGMMELTGEPDSEPVKFAVPVADIAAGMFAAFSIVSALYKRQSTGQGEYIDVSLLDAMFYWLTHQGQSFISAGYEPRRLGSAHPSIAPYRAYRARDGYFVVTVGNDSLWERFCMAIGRNDLFQNPLYMTNPLRVKNRVRLDRILSRTFSLDTVDHWVKKLQDNGIPCAKVNTLAEAVGSEYVSDKGAIVSVQHRKVKDFAVVFTPPTLRRFPARVSLPPPELGEHTFEVLRSIGYTNDKIRELQKEGVVRFNE